MDNSDTSLAKKAIEEVLASGKIRYIQSPEGERIYMVTPQGAPLLAEAGIGVALLAHQEFSDYYFGDFVWRRIFPSSLKMVYGDHPDEALEKVSSMPYNHPPINDAEEPQPIRGAFTQCVKSGRESYNPSENTPGVLR